MKATGAAAMSWPPLDESTSGKHATALPGLEAAVLVSTITASHTFTTDTGTATVQSQTSTTVNSSNNSVVEQGHMSLLCHTSLKE